MVEQSTLVLTYWFPHLGSVLAQANCEAQSTKLIYYTSFLHSCNLFVLTLKCPLYLLEVMTLDINNSIISWLILMTKVVSSGVTA